jgi:hypothetical protein
VTIVVDAQYEAECRDEFERIGEEQTQYTLRSGVFPEQKRQVAFRWLGEQARARAVREQRTYQYTRWTFFYARWTFFAAVAAVIVGIIGIVATLRH